MTYQSFHLCISHRGPWAYSLPSSRQKAPQNNMYLSAGEAVAPVITAFPSAFFTLHAYCIDPRVVVKTSLGLSPFVNKVCCLLSRPEGRWHWSDQFYKARLQLMHLIPILMPHPARIPSIAPSGTWDRTSWSWPTAPLCPLQEHPDVFPSHRGLL